MISRPLIRYGAIEGGVEIHLPFLYGYLSGNIVDNPDLTLKYSAWSMRILLLDINITLIRIISNNIVDIYLMIC